MKKRRRCKRCGKRWCGTTDKVMARYAGSDNVLDTAPWFNTYGSKKCRRKGRK